MKRAIVIVLSAGVSAAVLILAQVAHAGTFTAFGPEDYIRFSRSLVPVTRSFSVLDPSAAYTLHVYSAGKDDQFANRMGRAVVVLNTRAVVRLEDFAGDISHLQLPIRLRADNELIVKLRSGLDSGLTVEVTGSDDVPPTIVATATPPPNAAGWNRTNVTVSFACSDATSGIAVCSRPAYLRQEGAQQVVSGMATDRAGNTASTTVSVSIDKTPPVVTVTSPLPGETVERSPVIVRGTVGESLSGVADIACNGTLATVSGTSFTCAIPVVKGNNTVEIVARDVAGNASEAWTTVAYSPGEYDAIVDVMVTDDASAVPADYTGVAWGETSTEPYLPGVAGTRVAASNVNLGMGGSTNTSVWVRYSRVPIDSDQPVLVDYGTFAWPNWQAACPATWQRANGTSAGIQGGLNTGLPVCEVTKGLCVKYMPMKDAESFVTNVALSYTNGSVPCPALGRANSGYWPMQEDSSSIHTATGACVSAPIGLYLCYGRGRAWPSAPTSIEATDAEKLDLLHRFAPKVWLDTAEQYWPSSVDWAFPHLVRTPCFETPLLMGCGTGISPDEATSYWLFTEALVIPVDFSHGCNGSATSTPCTLGDAPAYAYWVKKPTPVGGDVVDVVDLVYFFYYPFNLGKEILGTVWESHVGDWEHVTVRLMWAYDDLSGWTLEPVQIYLSAHDFGGTYEWAAYPKDGTHPVVYAARGSHGVWATPGNHVYGSALGFPLVDVCSAGTAWTTWNNLVAFDFNGKQGLGGSTWPLWMSDDFADPGTCGNRFDPACGPIYRWGNMRHGCVFGYCTLTDGPTGPVSKSVWSPGVLQ